MRARKETKKEHEMAVELTRLREEYFDKFGDGFPMHSVGLGGYTIEEALPIIKEALATGIPAKPKYEYDYDPEIFY